VDPELVARVLRRFHNITFLSAHEPLKHLLRRPCTAGRRRELLPAGWPGAASRHRQQAGSDRISGPVSQPFT
jgi:hypothetical protein